MLLLNPSLENLIPGAQTVVWPLLFLSTGYRQIGPFLGWQARVTRPGKSRNVSVRAPPSPASVGVSSAPLVLSQLDACLNEEFYVLPTFRDVEFHRVVVAGELAKKIVA